jgi:hypothetical protein
MTCIVTPGADDVKRHLGIRIPRSTPEISEMKRQSEKLTA